MHHLLLKLCYALIFMKFEHFSIQFCLFQFSPSVIALNIGKFAV
ncbi:MAG: hypothetical protein RLZ77_1787 [Bacteroidota bacterium]|jgi:hypothetical protein